MCYGISADEAVRAFSKMSKLSATCFDELVNNAPITTKPYNVENVKFESFGGYNYELKRDQPYRCEYCGVTTDKRVGLCDYCGAPLNVIRRYCE